MLRYFLRYVLIGVVIASTIFTVRALPLRQREVHVSGSDIVRERIGDESTELILDIDEGSDLDSIERDLLSTQFLFIEPETVFKEQP
ncbi:MAG: hypothetical protein AAB372_03135 [Patescibacteria group bacterium]